MLTLGDEYEQFTATILEGIKSSRRKLSPIGRGRNNKIRGISGVNHQIDVSFIDYSFDVPTLLLIECKRYDEQKNPIQLDKVKVLKATLDDIAQDFGKAAKFKAMLVTTAKIRSGARKYANYYGVVIEQVPHNKRFTFRYENIISTGMVISAGHMSLGFPAKLIRRCENCGEKFEQVGEETICPICTSVNA
jgi:hypothetical protein